MALPGRIVALVQVGCGDLAAPGRIEDRDVGVAAHSDRTLPRIEPHDPGRVTGYEVNVSRQGISTAHNHLSVHHAEARLDSRVAAGCVVDPAADGLVLQRTAQLVGGYAMDRASHRSVPEHLLVLCRLQRRIGVIDLPVGALVVFGGVTQVLVQRLTIYGQFLAARLHDSGDAGRGGDVHHIEGGTGDAFCKP